MSFKRCLYSLAIICLIASLSCENKEDPVTVSTADLTLTVDENPSIGQILGSVTGTTNQGTISYSIASQTPSGALAIDASSGELTVADAAAFDFETNPTLTADITVANGTVSQTASVTVNLTNVADAVTVTEETVVIDENPTDGQSITTVVATVDSGTAAFSISSQTPAGAFAIDASTGALTVLDVSLFDYETNPILTVVVTATNGTATDDGTITVNLNDVVELTWIQASTNVAFGGVYGHRIVNFNNGLFMIGGIRGVNRINGVWSSSDGVTWSQVSTGGNIFSPRNGHQVVVFNNKIWVIGGFTDGGRSNEVWSSVDGTAWTQETTSGIFSPRSDHAAVVFNNNIYVVGGSEGTMLNDIWSSSDGISWTEVTTSGNLFSAREGHSLTVFNGQMMLIAGADLNPQQLLRQRNDIWTSTDGVTWTEVNVTGSLFLQRWIHGAIVHNDMLWVIGGDDETGNRFNDVWTSTDGATWTEQTSTPVFNARDQLALFIFDNKLWVSGGSNNNGIETDIWATND